MMSLDSESPPNTYARLAAGSRSPGPLGRLIGLIAGLAVLAAGLLLSAVVVVVVLALGLIVFAWFWWKTRALRRQLRERAAFAPGQDPRTDERPVERGQPAGGRRQAAGDITEARILSEESRPAEPFSGPRG